MRNQDTTPARLVTPTQAAINHNAVTAAAEQLTATGWVGDSHRFVEALLLTALGEGYRRIEKVPAPRGPGGSDQARADAKAATEAAVRASKVSGGRL